MDPEELWDFGTVRSTARPATVGRAYRPATAEPSHWESEEGDWKNGSTSPISASPTKQGSGSTGSSTYVASVVNKGDLPPLPSTSPSSKKFTQATVRHTPTVVIDYAARTGNKRVIEREPSDEYDDYEGHYEDYSTKVDGLERQLEGAQLDDDFADTTLLDSVVLPAIASVKKNRVFESDPSN